MATHARRRHSAVRALLDMRTADPRPPRRSKAGRPSKAVWSRAHVYEGRALHSPYARPRTAFFSNVGDGTSRIPAKGVNAVVAPDAVENGWALNGWLQQYRRTSLMGSRSPGSAHSAVAYGDDERLRQDGLSGSERCFVKLAPSSSRSRDHVLETHEHNREVGSGRRGVHPDASRANTSRGPPFPAAV